MLHDVIIAAFLGLLLGNGAPHFIRGITKTEYPCLAGNGAVTNLLGGWASFALVALALKTIDYQATSDHSLAALFMGVLAGGLVHATFGSRGRVAR